MGIFGEQDEQYIREWSVGKAALAKPTGFAENFSAAWDEFRHNDASGAYRDELRNLYDQRVETVKRLTGVSLDNPYGAEPSWLHNSIEEDVNPDDMNPLERSLWGASRLIPDPMTFLYQLFDNHDGSLNEYQRIQQHEQAIAEARAMLPPDQQYLIPSREELEKQMQATAKQLEERNADIASRSDLWGLGGQVLGTMGAATVQPEVLMTLPIGAPARVGLLSRVLIDAAIGGGVEAALQPQVQNQRAKLNLESGWGPALENIGAAAAGAGAFSGAAAVLGKIIRGGSKAFREHFGRDPLPEEAAAIDLARQSMDAEAATPYQERTAASSQVFQTNEQAASLAALEGRVIQPDELVQPENLTQRYVDQGASLRVLTNNDLDNIEVDAKLMQFKAGGDELGVTDRLQGVTKWEPERAGVGLVYEFSDGRQIIADGHQRLGLARRLAADGQQIEMPVIMLREIDGITPEEARARAAFKNIAEGTGTAADAAKVLRDMGATAEDMGLPPKSALVRDAEGLVRLNDDVFGMVINDILPDRFAAIIGRYVNDPFLQTNIAQLLVKLQPANVREAEQIVDQARRAGVSRGTQSTLFGEEDIAESLYLERARVLDRAQKMLNRNATTFRTLLDQEGEITGAGNVLDQGSNAARLEADQRIMAFIRAQANRKGMISDALTDAARKAKDTGQYQQPAREFLQSLTRAIEDGEGFGDVGRTDRPDVEFAAANSAADQGVEARQIVPDEDTIAMFEEPAGERAQAQTDRLDRELRDEVQASTDGLDQPAIGRPVSLRNIPIEANAEVLYRFKMDAPRLGLEELRANASRWQAELAKVGAVIGRRKGVEFRNPGAKSLQGIGDKMARKNYRDAREITDAVRAGFVVETPAQADALIRKLGENFRVLDEGWGVSPAGYFDRKVLVKFDDGTVGEVQIWHPKMLEEKDRAGHVLYEKMRRLEAGSPEYDQLLAEQRALYMSVVDQLPEDWRAVVDDFVSGSGGRPGNERLNTSGDTTRPESATSSTRAGSQSSDPAGTTQASGPDMMAGRPSQETNVNNGDSPLATEPGAEGLPQLLMPGIRAVADADRIAIEISRPLEGGNAPMDMGLFGVDVNQSDLADLLRQPKSTLADLEIPIGERIDAEGNRVAETATIRQVLDDLEADQEFVDQLNLCDRDAAA